MKKIPGQVVQKSGDRRARLVRFAAAATVIAVAFLGLRIAVWREFSRTVYYAQPMLDAVYYDTVARRVAEGHWQQDHACFMGPAFPYVLGVGYAVFGPAPWVGRALNFVCSVVILALAGWLGNRMGGRVAALGAMALWAVYRPALFFEQTLLMETMAGAMGLGVLALATAWFERKGESRAETPSRGGRMEATAGSIRRRIGERSRLWAGAFLCGLALGLAALTRANLLAFAPFLILYILWRIREHGRDAPADRKSEGGAPKQMRADPALHESAGKGRTDRAPKRSAATSAIWAGALFVVGVALGIAPASIHNARAERDFVAITSNAGINLYIGNNEKSRGYFVVPGGINTEQDPRGARVAERALGRTDLSSAAISSWWAGRAKAWIRQHPGAFLLNTARKVLLLFSAREIPQIYHQGVMREDLPFLRWPLAGFVVVGPLAVAGFVAGLRRSPARSVAALLLAYVVAQALSLLPFFVTGRYRLPIIPALCVAGGLGISALVDSARERRWDRLAAFLGVGVGVAGLSLWVAAAQPGNPTEVSQFESMHAALLIKAGRVEEARAILERRAGVAPTPGVWSNLGTIYASQPAEWSRAAEAYRKAAQLDPDDARIWFNLSQVLLRLNRREEAREALESAVALDPDVQPLAWFNLALVRKLAGDRAGAHEAIEEFLKRTPNDPQAKALLKELE